jgi:hypothetical protein
MVAVLLVASIAPFTLPVLRAASADDVGTQAGPDTPTSAAPVDTLAPGGPTDTATPGGPTDTVTPGDTATPGGPTTTTPDSAPAINSATPPPGDRDVRCDTTGGTPTGGATGDGVSVAVIDPTGFAVDDPAIEDQVAATASFAQGADLNVPNGGRNRHGTASARVVAREAPGASLYLANFRTAYDFERAVEWAIERDVDVVVAPTVFYAKHNDGSSPVSEAVTAATEAGVAVVVPTGNVAEHHWEDVYTGGGTVQFEPGDTRMYLRGDGDRVRLWLWWNRSDDVDPNAFSAVLYRETDDGTRPVASSEDYPVGPVGTNQVLTEEVRTNDLLDHAVENGSYFVRIEGPPNETHRVELVVPTHRLERPSARGSVMAPATATGPGPPPPRRGGPWRRPAAARRTTAASAWTSSGRRRCGPPGSREPRWRRRTPAASPHRCWR